MNKFIPTHHPSAVMRACCRNGKICLPLLAGIWLLLVSACSPNAQPTTAARPVASQSQPPSLPTRTVRTPVSPTQPVVDDGRDEDLPAPTATPIPLPADTPTVTSLRLPSAYVSTLNAPILRQPGQSVLRSVAAGERLAVIGRAGDWLLVRYTPDPDQSAVEGWVRRNQVSLLADIEDIPRVDPGDRQPLVPAADGVMSTAPSGTVLANRLNLRAGPGVDQAILDTLARNQVISVQGRSDNGEWLQVQTGDGISGWVALRWVRLDGNPEEVPVTGTATTNVPLPVPATSQGKIVFQNRNGGDIYLINANGTNLRRLTRGFDPVLSPDGQQVAFTRWDEPRGLWVIQSDGSGERHLVTANRGRSPTWTPAGDAIIFERNADSIQCLSTPLGCVTVDEWWQIVGAECVDTPIGRFCIDDFPLVTRYISGLMRVNLNSGELRDLPATVDARAPEHSPQGNGVLYLDRDGLAQTASQGDVLPTRIIQQEVGLSPASYSPDGRYVYLSIRAADHWDIWRYTGDGSQALALTAQPPIRSRPTQNVAPTLSPDGRTILFLSDRAGRWQLWRMDANGENARPFAPAALADIEFQYDFANERVADWGK